MNTYPAGRMAARGTEFDVRVTDEGEWQIDTGAEILRADTRKGLAGHLAAWVRRYDVKVAIPILVKQGNWNGGYTVRRATATGISARNRGIIATYDDTGEPAEVSAIGTGTILAGDADPQEWQRLLDEYNRAAQAMSRYQQAHKIESLPQLVRQAIREAVAGQAPASRS